MQSSSSKIWFAIIAVVVIAAGIGVWYFYFRSNVPSSTTATQSAVEQVNLPQISNGNTVQDIQNDLNQIPNDSGALQQDENSLNSSIQGL